MIAAESKERYIAAFEQSQSNGNGAAPAWLKELRRDGIASFAAQGFPTTKNEEWKYTSVEPIASLPLAQSQGSERRIDADEILARSFADAACPRLVFINGVWAREFSFAQDLPRGVRLASLAELIKQDDAAFVGAAWASCELSAPGFRGAQHGFYGRRRGGGYSAGVLFGAADLSDLCIEPRRRTIGVASAHAYFSRRGERG